MSKSVTVQFEDGTSHIYDDVPDHIDDSQVQERAATEFNKSIKQIAPGANTNLSAPKQESPGIGTKIIGGLETIGQTAAEHPLATTGIAAAAIPNSVLKYLPYGSKIVAGKEFFNNLGDAAKAYSMKEARLQGRPGFGTAPPTATYNVPTGVPSTNTMVTGPAVPTGGAPATTPVAPTQPSMIQRGMNYAQDMQRIAAQRVLPAVNTLARGSVAPGMALYHGGLNTNEEQELARRRGMGPTIQ